MAEPVTDLEEFNNLFLTVIPFTIVWVVLTGLLVLFNLYTLEQGMLFLAGIALGHATILLTGIVVHTMKQIREAN